jgi:membrane-bound lytic murein transglycosylase B
VVLAGLTVLLIAAGLAPEARAENLVAPRPAVAAPAALLAAPSPALPGLPGTALELAGVPVDSDDFREAAAAYHEVDAVHAEAQDARAGLDRSSTLLRARLRTLDATRASAQARIDGLSERLDAVEVAIQELAVAGFVAGGDDERLNEAVASEAPAINEVERRDVLGGLSMEVLLAERAAYLARIGEAEERVEQASADAEDTTAELEAIADKRRGAVVGEVKAAGDVASERVSYEEARVLAEVEGVEFPLVALDAYYRAAKAVEEDRPTCRVQWWGLAGISRVEGRHGTYGGTELMPNGDTTRPIIGIQLNGTNATAVVGDSDGGALDGDPHYDRAVGPMQFIPQTWRRYESDGNEDGFPSPFNLYDAALAAAKYLCTSSSGLDADPGLRTAYFSYNHSLPYVDSVLGYARLYERALEVPTRER